MYIYNTAESPFVAFLFRKKKRKKKLMDCREQDVNRESEQKTKKISARGLGPWGWGGRVVHHSSLRARSLKVQKYKKNIKKNNNNNKTHNLLKEVLTLICPLLTNIKLQNKSNSRPKSSPPFEGFKIHPLFFFLFFLSPPFFFFFFSHPLPYVKHVESKERESR